MEGSERPGMAWQLVPWIQNNTFRQWRILNVNSDSGKVDRFCTPNDIISYNHRKGLSASDALLINIVM